jgi:hypothetical protein
MKHITVLQATATTADELFAFLRTLDNMGHSLYTVQFGINGNDALKLTAVSVRLTDGSWVMNLVVEVTP